MKLASKLSLFLIALAPAFAAGPAWDSSGNSQLNGVYNFREVLYTSNGSGTISHQIAYSGYITFNGAGNYTLSTSNTQMNTGTALAIPTAGTYSVASSGYGFLSNPLVAGASLNFLVTNHIVLGSSTESGTNDMFIAAPTSSTTNASFKGGYTLASYRPGDGTPGGASDWLYQLNSDGAGNLTTVSMSGYVGSSPTLTGPIAYQNISYTTSNAAQAVMNIGGTAYLLCFSPDGNLVFGGSSAGYDMIVGVRNNVSNPAPIAPGLYYEAGLNEDESTSNVSIASYYGVFNNSSAGTIGNERLLYAGSSAESYTYTTAYPPGGFITSNTYNGPSNIGQLNQLDMVKYTVGVGLVRIGLGIGPYLGIDVALPAAAPTPSGTVFIDPTGIVNTASSAPFIAGVSPGEFITLYNGVSVAPVNSCWTSGLPFPPTIAGVQVLFNGTINAPIYCVGSQITVMVPYEVSANPITSIQVVNNGVPSNTVTAYVYPTTPGVFSYPAGGLGFAAAQHGDYSLVTTANPALKGEYIAVYLSGLGNVATPAPNGGASPATGDKTTANIQVYVDGKASPSVPYAGLTPGAASLYQVNFQIPMTATAGTASLAIVGPGAFATEATLPVGPVESTTIGFIP